MRYADQQVVNDDETCSAPVEFAEAQAPALLVVFSGL